MAHLSEHAVHIAYPPLYQRSLYDRIYGQYFIHNHNRCGHIDSLKHPNVTATPRGSRSNSAPQTCRISCPQSPHTFPLPLPDHPFSDVPISGTRLSVPCLPPVPPALLEPAPRRLGPRSAPACSRTAAAAGNFTSTRNGLQRECTIRLRQCRIPSESAPSCPTPNVVLRPPACHHSSSAPVHCLHGDLSWRRSLRGWRCSEASPDLR